MSIESRRIIVSFNEDGTPVYKQLKAFSQDEMNIKIVRTFIESGRIYEILSSCDFSLSGRPVLLKDYCKEWINRKRRVKENTRVTYLKRINQYIIPFLGNLRIDEIKVSDVQQLLDKHSDLANKTLSEIRNTLSQIFKYAVSDDLIKKNPCESVDLVIPSSRKSERKALPLNEYQEIISNLHMLIGNDRKFLALCLFTGMRKGEVLGLRWEDLFSGSIHVRRNVTFPQKNQPSVTTPKTKASIRSIPLSDPLIFTLQPFSKSGFVVGGEKPLTQSAYRAMWNRIKKSIDLHGATPHILRHSYLTYAVGSTTDYKTVQGISGHSDLFTLVNRYAHPQEDKVKELSSEMTKILTQNVEKC